MANRRNYYWDFVSLYHLVAAVKKMKTDIGVYRQLKSSLLAEKNERYLSLLESFSQEQQRHAVKFLEDTQKDEDAETSFLGLYEKGKGIIGVLAYDYKQRKGTDYGE